MQVSSALLLATLAQAGPLPDFSANTAQLLSPATAEIGDAVHVTATFASVSATFTGTAAVAVVASGDAQYDAQDPVIHLGAVTFPSGAFDATFALDVAPGRGIIPGAPVTLFVVVDPMNDVAESNETNNAVAASPTLTIQGPDVRVVSLQPAPNVFIGVPFQARITLKNDGIVNANSFQYRYYISRDTVIRVFDTPIGDSPEITLAPGQTATFTDTLILPGTFTSTGSWYIGVQVDIFSDLLESNLGNNIAAAQPAVRVLYPIPDLTAEVVSTATAGAAGEDLSITRILSNVGPADATDVEYEYFLSRDESLDPADTPLGTFTTAIGEAAFGYGVDVVRIPASTLPNDYHVLLVMDPNGLTEEVDETNNVAVGPKIPIYEATVRIRTTQLPLATVGVLYETGLYANGGPLEITWSVERGALPAGITLDPSGLLSGTPTTEGLYEVTFRASSGSAYSERTYALRVLSPTVTPTFATTALPAAFVGRPFCSTLIAVGGQTPYRWRALTGLPPGATLSDEGALCGTVFAAGSYRITFEVTDALGVTATRLLTLHVLRPDATVHIVPLPLPTAVFGEELCDPTDVTFSAEGGLEPYRWSIVDGEVPGLTLSPEGLFCGVPERAGLFPITVRVQDEALVFDTALFLVEVATDNDFLITTRSLPDTRVGSTFSAQLSVINDSGAVTWSLITGSGDLPPGLTLDANGALGGTPTSAGIYAFAVRADDATGQSDLAPMSIRVAEEAKLMTEPKGGCTNTFGGGDGWWALLAPLYFALRRRR